MNCVDCEIKRSSYNQITSGGSGAVRIGPALFVGRKRHGLTKSLCSIFCYLGQSFFLYCFCV